MKIFIIRNAWRHADYGGAEEFAISLTMTLNQQGAEAILVSGSKALLNKAAETSTPYVVGQYSTHQILTKHRAVFLPKYLIDIFFAYRSYLKLFGKEQPDIVHCNGQQDSISATFAAHKLGIPVIWSDHGELKNSMRFSFMPPWGIPGLLLRKAAKKTTKLLMINQKDIQTVKKSLQNSKIITIPNGVIDRYDPNVKRTTDLVFASRVIREKGIFELLSAFEVVKKTHPKLRLVIAGDGPSLSQAKKIALKDVVFKSYADEDIRTAGVFILPTYTEAQSLAILKAMMYKTPIISTNIDGNTHFLTHKKHALLVEPRNYKELAYSIELLLSDVSLRDSMVATSRELYEKNYKLSTIVRDIYIPLYKDLTN
jgi:glycosyltransferase involved in cell wall biosynthesis